jgi:hypothetical protein
MKNTYLHIKNNINKNIIWTAIIWNQKVPNSIWNKELMNILKLFKQIKIKEFKQDKKHFTWNPQITLKKSLKKNLSKEKGKKLSIEMSWCSKWKSNRKKRIILKNKKCLSKLNMSKEFINSYMKCNKNIYQRKLKRVILMLKIKYKGLIWCHQSTKKMQSVQYREEEIVQSLNQKALTLEILQINTVRPLKISKDSNISINLIMMIWILDTKVKTHRNIIKFIKLHTKITTTMRMSKLINVTSQHLTFIIKFNWNSSNRIIMMNEGS